MEWDEDISKEIVGFFENLYKKVGERMCFTELDWEANFLE